MVAAVEVKPVGIPCRGCKKTNGEPRIITRLVVEGTATVFQKCHWCGTYNVKQVVNGELIE